MKEDERKDLRSELQFLKSCQVQYFILSVTAAGAVAGFGERLTRLQGAPSIYLAPLLVVIPCWWIFFDKATTISRIVAYLRILEEQILAGNGHPLSYVGWENALSRYRKAETAAPLVEKIKDYLMGLLYGLRYSLTFATTHKYWSINWWTFAGLAGTSLWLGSLDPGVVQDPNAAQLPGSVQVLAWRVLVSISIISLLHNLSVVGRLTHGSYSYRGCAARWRGVL